MSTVARKENPPPYGDTPPLTLRLHPVLNLTDEQFFEFAQINRDLRIERNAQGELIVMPPTGGETGKRNAEITIQFGVWAKKDGSGVIFDSSTGFRLPSGAIRSPDASWVKRSRLAGLTAEERKKFIPLCPDFVIELLLSNDSLPALQDKMQEYIANGAQLGWLLDTEQRRVYVYRPEDTPMEQMDNPATISGEPVLAGFVLDLGEIW